MVQWQQMKQQGFVPEQAKSVAHETRNGILMCGTHQLLFDRLYFYIRWVPEVKRLLVFEHISLTRPTAANSLRFDKPFSEGGPGSLSWPSDKSPRR